MCCRSPAAVKTLCTGPPPPPRGSCPAEIENKLAAYGNSTKQLVHLRNMLQVWSNFYVYLFVYFIGTTIGYNGMRST